MNGLTDKARGLMDEVVALLAAAPPEASSVVPVGPWVSALVSLLALVSKQAETIRRLTTESREAQNWQYLRDEVHRLDQLARPGAKMGDDDILQVIVPVLRAAAKDPGFHPGLLGQARRMRALLVEHEFSATAREGDPECPDCRGDDPSHLVDCKWSAILEETKALA